MATLPEIAALTQKGGDTEGGRMVQILAASRRCAVQEAIQKARAANCGRPTPISRKQVPLESTNLAGQLAACARITSTQAQIIASQPLRGVPESVRIKQLQMATEAEYAPYNNPQRRFIAYQGPQVPVVCPPLPTEILNANLPKPSTRCDTLNLLATGVPPNSLPR